MRTADGVVMVDLESDQVKLIQTKPHHLSLSFQETAYFSAFSQARRVTQPGPKDPARPEGSPSLRAMYVGGQQLFLEKSGWMKQQARPPSGRPQDQPPAAVFCRVVKTRCSEDYFINGLTTVGDPKGTSLT